MKKTLTFLCMLIVVSLLFVGCESSKTDPTTDVYNKDGETETVTEDNKLELDIIVPSGTPAMSMVKLMEEQPSLGENVEVNYEVVASTDALKAKVIAGEADIAIVPTNLASILYNKGINYQVAATSVWGNLYLVSDKPLSSTSELANETIYLFGQGLSPDIIFTYLLEHIGINKTDDLEINYLQGATEIAPLFLTGEAHVALIPEPMLTKVKAKKDVTVILDLQEEWKNVTGQDTSYPQASLIVNKDFIESNPEILNTFLDMYEDSINWINENPAQTGEYYESQELGLEKAIVEASIPQSNIMYKGANEAKDAINTYLEVLHNYSPDTVGGQLPDENFYYQR
ncbi:ABC transporter substrate-binding protein [Vallitalea okinawensis]|uniref:ABC transporter substrate-binding protein n=1 Tax=Vallitalea okinawensis TaxID=2078660 RepID=UPI000CFC738C|nr:MqnA/MqnD/SBP family protein [Vallitalea okinawensis]